MQYPKNVFLSGTFLDTPEGKWCGLEVFSDFSENPPVEETFDAIAGRILRAVNEEARDSEQRVTFSIVVLGIERGEDDRVQELKAQYGRMWERNPELLSCWAKYRTPFALWFVDGENHPFEGIICRDPDGDYILMAGPDLRETQPYTSQIKSGHPAWMLPSYAIRPSNLADARSFQRQAETGQPPAEAENEGVALVTLQNTASRFQGYFFGLDLSGELPFTPLWDRLADQMGKQISPGPVAMAVLVFGIAPGEGQRQASALRGCDEMLERHPEVYQFIKTTVGSLMVYLIDEQQMPYHFHAGLPTSVQGELDHGEDVTHEDIRLSFAFQQLRKTNGPLKVAASAVDPEAIAAVRALLPHGNEPAR